MTTEFLRIAVDAPLPNWLTYGASGPLVPERGQSVIVPLGKRKASGVVLGTTTDPGKYSIREIQEFNEARPRLNENHLRWLEWLAEYYVHPIGQVTALSFPPLSTAKRQRASAKGPLVPLSPARAAPQLTAEQEKVLRSIPVEREFRVHLVHGVTGSGKTEIYLRLLEQALALGRQGLVLVPEIALTPQLVERFAARFGERIAVLHSYLTDREKTEQWWNIVNGTKSILIGTRSALFCPLPQLGIIIVDEEHETSFKQDEKLKYHGRDAAIMLGKISSCPVVLGSATPSLESWANASRGQYQLHQLVHRVLDRPLPRVEVLDLRRERQERRDHPAARELPFWLSEALYGALQETLDKGEQGALFLNRRGMAQVALCQACGKILECPNCSISLTAHGRGHLVCHYCNYTTRLPEHCEHCSSDQVHTLGLGTERLEEDLKELFPGARIARADRDEIGSREDLESLIAGIERREIDFLIGTQMIAKGLDFPGLNLVGLVLADVGFSMPDFRAAERSFQLLTQVAGRAGRHSATPGRVIIQTYNPEHPAILFTREHSYRGFAEHELKSRSQLGYPPYQRLAAIRIHGLQIENVRTAAQSMEKRAQSLLASAKFSALRILGPAPAPLARLRNRYRFHALVKGPGPRIIRDFSQLLLGDLAWLPSGVKINLDVDPLNMM